MSADEIMTVVRPRAWRTVEVLAAMGEPLTAWNRRQVTKTLRANGWRPIRVCDGSIIWLEPERWGK